MSGSVSVAYPVQSIRLVDKNTTYLCWMPFPSPDRHGAIGFSSARRNFEQTTRLAIQMTIS